MQCVKATFINFLLKPKQLFGLPQVFKLNRRVSGFSWLVSFLLSV